MKMSHRLLPNSLRSIIFAALRFWLIVLSVITLQTITVFSQDTDTPESSEETQATFQITLAELGYQELILNSPYGTTEITLRLPEGWELERGSFFRLDFSYAYDLTDAPEENTLPNLFGELKVAIDGQTLQSLPIQETSLEYARLRVPLPPSLFNDPALAGRSHRVEITLDANIICEVAHKASLTIHPTSFFSLTYNQLPITTDLALYPRPFYQRSFEPDQIRFVLPNRPTETELAGAMAVAAQLGDLTYGMTISSTTDLALLTHLESTTELHEHLIVIGKPETNEVIRKLGQMDVLPLPLRERQLSLTTKAPVVIAPQATLTYTLTLTNTAQDIAPSLSLVNTLPAHTQLIACNPSCNENKETREISWTIPSLNGGETTSYAFGLSLNGAITNSVLENTAILLNASAEPINVNTITTTISSAPPSESDAELHLSASGESNFFFVQGERAVPEHDGVVQEIVSPWDQTRAILIVTGLSDEAIVKAGRAMSSRNLFPGLEGSFALVQGTQPRSETPTEPQGANLTFAELGYDDRVLRGSLQEASYYFDLPAGWRLTKSAYLELYFTHSQLLDFENSFLSVYFNNTPIATIALSGETAQGGYVKMELPASQTRHGQSNRISIQADMQSLNICTDLDTWLLINSESRLNLEHEEQNTTNFDLDFYPHPFNQHPDLADVLFALPSEPQPTEWEKALQLAAALGRAAGGSNLTPATVLGDNWSETELSNYHIVVIGRPSRSPLLQQTNAQLPQPFLPNSDEIEQKLNAVILRLPPETSLGYVQLIPSPWNKERALLVATGTTDESIKWAIDVLIDQTWVLEGNLTLITSDAIHTIDTRGLTSDSIAMAVATAVPEMTPVATSMVAPTPSPPGPTPTPSEPIVSDSEPGFTPTRRPTWLIPLVAATGLIVIAIFALAFWQARRKRS
jgi:hypothetical protein